MNEQNVVRLMETLARIISRKTDTNIKVSVKEKGGNDGETQDPGAESS